MLKKLFFINLQGFDLHKAALLAANFLLFLHLTIYFTVLSNVYIFKPNTLNMLSLSFSFIMIPCKKYAETCFTQISLVMRKHTESNGSAA